MFEQFSGYFGLEDIDLSAYAGRTMPIDIVLGRARTQQSQVVKQADVVALLGLLPEKFAGDAAERNFRYYEPRCSHGSSLRPAMDGLVAARLGDTVMALRFLRQTAAIDLAEAGEPMDLMVAGTSAQLRSGVVSVLAFGQSGAAFHDTVPAPGCP